MIRKKAGCWALAALCAGLAAQAQTATPAPAVPQPAAGDFDQFYTDLHHFDTQKSVLGRGINLGNMLDAGAGDGLMATGDLVKDSQGKPNGEGFWSNGRKIQAADFRIIRQAGFNSVRIPMRWTLYTSLQAPYEVNPLFKQRARQVVDAALREGLAVVINVHHYVELCEGTGELDQAAQRQRLKAIWAQISALFPEGEPVWPAGSETAEWPVNTGGYPARRLVFELLNEPNKLVDQYLLGEIHEELISELRQPATPGARPQPKRMVMLGSTNWSGMNSIDTLQLPDSCTASNTIITVHNYEPFHFTHQGASFLGPEARSWKGTRWQGTAREQQDMRTLFDKVSRWNAAPGRGFEVYLGEFGVFSGSLKGELLDDQKRWTAFMARECEARGFSWAYWEFNQGFGAWDARKKAWRPHLLQALIPQVK